MRILVTGAQGCIGAWTVKALLDRGLDVVVYDLDPHPRRLELIAPAEQVSRVAIRTGNIEDTGAVKALVKDEGITHIVHLAAQLMPFCQANPVAGALVNVIGTLNVFEAARDAGRPVRVVYASSSAVWGPEEAYGSGKLTEADPLKPSTHYGVFKQANEGNARVFYSAERHLEHRAAAVDRFWRGPRCRADRRSHARHESAGAGEIVSDPADGPHGSAIRGGCSGGICAVPPLADRGSARVQPGGHCDHHG